MNIKSLHRPVMTGFVVIGILALTFATMPMTAYAAISRSIAKPSVGKLVPIVTPPAGKGTIKPLGGGGTYRIVPGYTTPGYRPYGSKKGK